MHLVPDDGAGFCGGELSMADLSQQTYALNGQLSQDGSHRSALACDRLQEPLRVESPHHRQSEVAAVAAGQPMRVQQSPQLSPQAGAGFRRRPVPDPRQGPFQGTPHLKPLTALNTPATGNIQTHGACPGADAACAGGEEEAALLQQSSRQAIAQSSSCDMSGCQGCSGEQCQLCRDDKAKECCLDQFCKGCSGEQCTYCREDHMAGCCAGKHPGTPGCSGPSPTPSPPACDTSGCQGCSGEQCQLCVDEKQKDCCLDQACRGCSGEQCTYCREDHMAGCCAGKHPGTPGCSGPSPTPSPPTCDTSGCQGCSGEQCQLCVDEKQKDCCLDQACRGCSGEQCTYCREDHMAGCCAGKHPGTPGCSGPSPTPSPPTPSPPSPTPSPTPAPTPLPPNTLGCTATPAGTCGNPDILCYWEPDCANGGLCCKADGKTNECKFCGVGSCGDCP
ncbi:unnamed protein product [Prorocentrum cordatum]|uniref:Uncharacterized protein n=1 Tax=Prorocentrum cordatum TaxID=2364126 RepID=A0ABN9X021_9DINO|nr:unnamed protein product [Polarella glacialis]